MPRYMVEMSHTPSECIAAGFGEGNQRAQDLLGEAYWGCMSGVHNGWVVINADSEEDARKQVPENMRDKVTITEVDTVSSKLDHAIDPNTAHPGQDPPFWS